ncbi:hypothetical protein IFM89_030643, partial [Coptis chinensis]
DPDLYLNYSSMDSKSVTAATIEARELKLATSDSVCRKNVSQFQFFFPWFGSYHTSSAMFSGKKNTKDIDEKMINVQTKNSFYIGEWNINNVKSSVCEIPPEGLKVALTNSTSIQEMSRRNSEQITIMFRKMAILHWYSGDTFDSGQSGSGSNLANDHHTESVEHINSVLYSLVLDLNHPSNHLHPLG